MLRRRLTTGAVLATGALLLAACQGVPEGAIEASGERCPEGSACFDPVRPVGPGGELSVESYEWGFDLIAGTPVDGGVVVTLDNTRGGATHNFRIDAATGETKKVEAEAGETATATLALFAGEYTYYCDIPGHRANGMEGTLTVFGPDEDPTDIGQDVPTEASEEPVQEPPAGEEPPPGGEAPTEQETTPTPRDEDVSPPDEEVGSDTV